MNTRYGAGNRPSSTLWCKRRPAGVYQQSTGLLIEWVRAPAAPRQSKSEQVFAFTACLSIGTIPLFGAGVFLKEGDFSICRPTDQRQSVEAGWSFPGNLCFPAVQPKGKPFPNGVFSLLHSASSFRKSPISPARISCPKSLGCRPSVVSFAAISGSFARITLVSNKSSRGRP